MSEDELLSRLGENERDAQIDDARFERVAGGSATRDDLDALARAAADDPKMAVRLEGSLPLDPEAVERIALSAENAMTGVRVVGGEGSSPKCATSERGAAAPRDLSPGVVALPTSPTKRRAAEWKRQVVIFAGPLALAAALLVYIAGQRGPSASKLPTYTVIASGDQVMRGPSEVSARLRLARNKDARFELLVRPVTASESKVVAYAFTLNASDAEPAPLDASVEIAGEGAVRMRGSSRALDGADEIRIVVGAPTAIGKFDDAIARARANTTDAQVRVLTVPIDRE